MRRLLALLALLWALAIQPAQAAILTICAEDINCTLIGTWIADPGAGNVFISPGYSRTAIFGNWTPSASFPPPNRIETPAFIPSANFWTAYRLYESSTSTTLNYTGPIWFDAGGTARLMLRGTGSPNSVTVVKRDAAGNFTTVGSPISGLTCVASTICKYDIHVVYGTSGLVEVYTNGTLAGSVSGDLTTDGATGLSKLGLSSYNNGVNHAYTEVVVADTDTRSMRLTTCAPLAAGNAQQWTGAVGNVNPTAYNDANFNYTTMAGQLSQWTTGCSLVPTAGVIVDVLQYGRLSKSTSGPQTFRFSLRDGGANYTNPADLAMALGFTNYSYSWGPTSPATGLPWTIPEINAGLQYGVVSGP